MKKSISSLLIAVSMLLAVSCSLDSSGEKTKETIVEYSFAKIFNVFVGVDCVDSKERKSFGFFSLLVADLLNKL